MQVIELNRSLENSTHAFVWIVATGAREVKFNCLSAAGQFSSVHKKAQDTIDFVAECHDSTPLVDRLYAIDFAMPVSKLRIEVNFTGTITMKPQVLLDFTKSSRVITRVLFKSPFPLSNFKLILSCIFDSLANPWSRFDYDYLNSNKFLAPYYAVSALDGNLRDDVQLAIRNLDHLDVTMTVISSDKASTEEEVRLLTK